MPLFRVLVTGAQLVQPAREILEGIGAALTMMDGKVSEPVLVEALAHHAPDAVLMRGNPPFSRPVLAQAAGLKVIAKHGAGVDSVDLQAATAMGIAVIIGAALPISGVSGLSLTAEYRFMGLSDDRTYGGPALTTRLTGRNTLRVSDDYNNSLLIGLRYAFNAAPPTVPVAPAPAPEAARTYLVFFDWDRADLTDRARQIVRQAAEATTRVQVTRIRVNGYTDLSGGASYNMGLSIRRAGNVANELVRNGVPRSAISIQGFGKTHRLVPTADGVREPQNRRVEIILQ